MKMMIRTLAFLAAGGAALGASTLVASPWGAAAAHGTKLRRMANEQHVTVEEIVAQLREAHAERNRGAAESADGAAESARQH